MSVDGAVGEEAEEEVVVEDGRAVVVVVWAARKVAQHWSERRFRHWVRALPWLRKPAISHEFGKANSSLVNQWNIHRNLVPRPVFHSDKNQDSGQSQ